MMDDLPEDIMVKILCKLPVKEVIRVTSLQRSFYSLVHSKFFNHSYNKEALINGANPPLIFFQFLDYNDLVNYSLRSYNESIPLHYPSGTNYLYFPQVGCCNSLVCLCDYKGKQLILWNPYIQKTLILPKSNYDIERDCFFGMGFVNETSDFKVLMINKKHQAELYSLHLNCWKVITGTPVDIHSCRTHNPVCVQSSLYWLCKKFNPFKNAVSVFDFKSEVFGEISLPDELESLRTACNLQLRAHRVSLIAVGDGHDISEARGSDNDISYIQIMDVNEKRWNKHYVIGSPWRALKGEEIVRGRYGTVSVPRDGSYNIYFSSGYIARVSVCNYVSNLALLDG